MACMHGHRDVARLLIENNASVNSHNVYKETPLMLAARFGHTDVAKLLLHERDCDFAAETDNGVSWSSIHRACGAGHVDFALELLDKHPK